MAITVNGEPSSAPIISSPTENDKMTEVLDSSNPSGLTAPELNDPNSINVTISDKKTPIVVLFGPPTCGKTMTLVRLARYLVSKGYTVVPEKTFRPSYDKNYEQLCNNFGQMINSHTAAKGTSNISFMLVKVLRSGRPICQLLEAPGEYYFKPDEPSRPYPPYVLEIIKSDNRKIWAIMIELDWKNSSTRADYVTRIMNLKSQMFSRDKVVFICNKIDKNPEYVFGVGQVNTKEVINSIRNQYPGIFAPFENRNPITSFFQKYNCEFVPFMTGSFSQTLSGGSTFTEGHEIYAKKLWNTILNQIRG